MIFTTENIEKIKKGYGKKKFEYKTKGGLFSEGEGDQLVIVEKENEVIGGIFSVFIKGDKRNILDLWLSFENKKQGLSRKNLNEFIETTEKIFGDLGINEIHLSRFERKLKEPYLQKGYEETKIYGLCKNLK